MIKMSTNYLEFPCGSGKARMTQYIVSYKIKSETAHGIFSY
jgi:hypothetical protein